MLQHPSDFENSIVSFKTFELSAQCKINKMSNVTLQGKVPSFAELLRTTIVSDDVNPTSSWNKKPNVSSSTYMLRVSHTPDGLVCLPSVAVRLLVSHNETLTRNRPVVSCDPNDLVGTALLGLKPKNGTPPKQLSSDKITPALRLQKERSLDYPSQFTFPRNVLKESNDFRTGNLYKERFLSSGETSKARFLSLVETSKEVTSFDTSPKEDEAPQDQFLALIGRDSAPLIRLHSFLGEFNNHIPKILRTSDTTFEEIHDVDHLQLARKLVKVLESASTFSRSAAKKRHRKRSSSKSLHDVITLEVNTAPAGHTQQIDFGGLNTELSVRPNIKCHQCDLKETPEWRRGPYGNRTLCNACGLFYSKLVKKLGIDEADEELKVRKSDGRVLDRRTS